MTAFLQTILLYLSWIGGAAGVAGFVVLVYLYRRNEQKERDRLKRTKADIADIMILFQTMRDVTKQQKSLAREFNEELDRKMGVVKEVLTRGLDKNKQLYDRQQNLVRELDTMRAELQRLHNLVKQLQVEARGTAPTDSPARVERGIDAETEHGPARGAQDVEWSVSRTEENEHRAPQAFVSLPEEPEQVSTPEDTKLRGTGLTEAPFQEWMGLDFDEAMAESDARAESNADALYGEVQEPQAPADPVQARRAFRDLLDLSDTSTPPGGDTTKTAPDEPSAANDEATSPIQKRVLEYREAGMSVAQIAKELGIGKGEVRLMLSLAQPKQG